MSEFEKMQQGRLEERNTENSIFLSMDTRSKGAGMPDFHYHTTYELFYIKSGRADFIIGNNTYTIGDGNLLVIPPYVPHRSMYPKTKTERIEVCIRASQLNAHMAELLQNMSQHICYTVSLKHQEFILQLFHRIGKELEGGRAYSEDLCMAYICELLVTLYRHAVQADFPGCMQTAVPEKVMEYVSQHYAQRITISELAAELNVCESTIFKTFKRYTGLKVTDYINFTRIMNAERMMRETKLPLLEIAYQCGFTDCNYFSMVFKKYKNVTPGKFMKSCR